MPAGRRHNPGMPSVCHGRRSGLLSRWTLKSRIANLGLSIGTAGTALCLVAGHVAPSASSCDEYPTMTLDPCRTGSSQKLRMITCVAAPQSSQSMLYIQNALGTWLRTRSRRAVRPTPVVRRERVESPPLSVWPPSSIHRLHTEKRSEPEGCYFSLRGCATQERKYRAA